MNTVKDELEVFVQVDPAEEPSIWQELASLWEHSARCPFQAPAILRYYSGQATGNTLVLGLRGSNALMAATVLHVGVGGRLTFLSDLKTDVNRFLFHTDTTDAERIAFFDQVLTVMREQGWSWTLNNQPADDPAVSLLEQRASRSGLYWTSFLHSACPVVEAATPEALFDHINGFRELRYRVNRLTKRPDTHFEVFTDDTALAEWATAFCTTHQRRWDGTPTPSHLRDPERRRFFTGCLTAWNTDGLLVRFSIREGATRIGFVVALRFGDTLIHHSTTYDPDHAKSSPGKALIWAMGQWMRDNGYRTLDFGDGREEYKYTVATGERPLKRIFISPRSNYRFILSVNMIRTVQRDPRLYDLYQKHVKRWFRN